MLKVDFATDLIENGNEIWVEFQFFYVFYVLIVKRQKHIAEVFHLRP